MCLRASAGEAFGSKFRAGADVEEDLRVLPVKYDAGSERWRGIDDCLQLASEIEFEDWPIEGPRTTLYSLRQLRKRNLGWLQHHELWVNDLGSDLRTARPTSTA